MTISLCVKTQKKLGLIDGAKHVKVMRQQGLTLLEIIVTLAIIVILTVAALTVYTNYVRRSRRIDAVNTILSISLAEERYRSTNTTYGTLAQVWGGVSTSPNGYYTIAISGVSGTAYTITVTAVGNQATDTTNGVSCGTLTFTMNNGTVTKSPSACWP